MVAPPPPAPPGICPERSAVAGKALGKALKLVDRRPNVEATKPVLLSYYLYRAADGPGPFQAGGDVTRTIPSSSRPGSFLHAPEHLESVNLGNLQGVLAYLHHEVTEYSRCWPDRGPGIWRKFGIDRITRWNVTSVCTQQSYDTSIPGRQCALVSGSNCPLEALECA